MCDGHGYLQVNVKLDGRHRPVRVHRLVAAAFLPAPASSQNMVRHLDDDPTNNAVPNLCWGTQRDQKEDMRRNGSQTQGENHHLAKVTEANVLDMCVRHAKGESFVAIGRRFGVTAGAVRNAVIGRTWKHLRRR